MNSPIMPLYKFPPHVVLVNASCTNAAIILDGATLIGGKYVGCNFYYDGEDFYRDSTVVVEQGHLILGPHVSADSYFFERAHKSMPELKPITYRSLPDAESIRKTIWPEPGDAH